ncbi:peptidoglycan-binding domain-containing protein [Streptomyces sp. NPDC002845]
MNFRAKTASVLGAAAVATASLVALPGTAHAAYPTCNGVKNVDTSHGNVRQPYYTGTGSRNCVMGVGTRSSAVTRLQIVLRNCYNQDLTADGRYGSSTSSAVKYVQRYEGLSSSDIDGVYGPLTRKAMKWHTSSGICIRPAI